MQVYQCDRRSLSSAPRTSPRLPGVDVLARAEAWFVKCVWSCKSLLSYDMIPVGLLLIMRMSTPTKLHGQKLPTKTSPHHQLPHHLQRGVPEDNVKRHTQIYLHNRNTIAGSKFLLFLCSKMFRLLVRLSSFSLATITIIRIMKYHWSKSTFLFSNILVPALRFHRFRATAYAARVTSSSCLGWFRLILIRQTIY
jgi:hypothetical protein